MAFTPLVFEPQYVRMTGFHQDLTVGGGTFFASVVAQRRDVSQFAQDLIWDAVHGGTALERLGTKLGWNWMTAGNVTGFTTSNYLMQVPPSGTDPQLIIKVRGGLAGSSPKITREVTYGTAPEADQVIITLEGGLFESEDEDDETLIFWWGLHAIGLGLGLGHASDERDIMFPVFRGEEDSGGANIFASTADIAALEVLVAGAPAATGVVVGGASLPTADPIAGAVALTTDRTFYVDGESMAITVTVDDTAAADLPNAIATVVVTGATGQTYVARGITNSSGVMTAQVQVGGPFGFGTYTLTPSAEAGGATVYGTAKTVTVDD